MDDTTAAKAALKEITKHKNFARWHKLFPTSAWMRKRAPRGVPRFAFEYADTGAGNDIGIRDNWNAFDAIKIVPRYGVINKLPPVGTTLFGTQYAAPVGVAPMGAPSLVWAGGDKLLAKAAQRARVPYTLSMAGGASPEEIGAIAPDVFWMQLYRIALDDHSIGYDVVRRAKEAGVKVLALTIDVPVRTTRSRETYAGLGGEFKPTARMLREMLLRPKWLWAIRRHGYPRFATLREYVGKHASNNDVIRFARTHVGGAFSWDEIARYRDKWQGPMVLKGILHPADAEKAVSLGIDGMWVSNHGGRQIEALAPTIDALPSIVSAVGSRATIVIDSGVRSGQDVLRAVALGADAAFAGKSFLWAIGALGDEGPDQLIDLYIDELRASLGQIGALSLAEARSAKILHPGAIKY
jgi:L-lactate dehydrogenase (cytochrome)